MATKKRDRVFAGFFAGLFIISSCVLTAAVIYTLVRGDDSNNAQEVNMDDGNKLTGTKMKDFTPTSQPQAELQVTDVKEGTGTEVKAGDSITADYVGALMSDGTIFDASADHGGPQTFSLDGVIAGWSQGIPGMKEGGTRRILIPASLGYGTQGNNSIPPNADLVFDVTVVKVNQ